ncbi:MAG: hypothetical protein V4749_05300 [Pseudomonadota bacterium]
MDGPRVHKVLEGRAQISGKSIEEETVLTLDSQSISSQMLPIDCDMQHT